MLTHWNGKKTKIRVGDVAIFYLNRKTLVFHRKRSKPEDNRLRWDNGDDQKIVVHSGKNMAFADTYSIIGIICQTHGFEFSVISDESRATEPTVAFIIK